MQAETSSNVFVRSLEAAVSQMGAHDRQVLASAFKSCPDNERQKLKAIKKVLDSNQDSPSKQLIQKQLGAPLLQEYVFGSLESKPTMINVLKNVDIPIHTLLSFKSDAQSFDECKRVVEVLEVSYVHHKLRKEDKQSLLPLSRHLYEIFSAQMEKGSEMIARNQFRTKWLQSFVEVLRCVNYIAKFIEANQRQQFKELDERVLKLANTCICHTQLLSKEVITQLFLLVVFLDEKYPEPEDTLHRIHYLHARNIVKNQNTLLALLKMGFELKDTEQKCQLVPILLKSFQQHYKGEAISADLKNNSFDMAITLFDVGRSIYSYLEEIIDLIILNGGSWNLEGSSTRKYFITRIALKHVPTQVIFEMWPTVIEDCIAQSGSMILPYVADCAEILLASLYRECNGNFEEWMQKWIQPYKKALISEDRHKLRGIIEFINPMLLRINSTSPQLLKEVLHSKQAGLNTQLGVISLIKCYRELGKIVPWQEFQAEGEDKKCFVFVDDPSFTFAYDFLSDLLQSNDQMIACNALEFLTTSRKPSTLLSPSEMKLILLFYQSCLKTSSPEFRKNYLNLTRRMFERFRRIYERDLTGKTTKTVGDKVYVKETKYYNDFVGFLSQIIDTCFSNLYPDSIFEISNPALEILILIVTLYGPEREEVKKGVFVDPTDVLVSRTTFFRMQNFYNLVSCLQSSYESIRSLAHSIINRFKSAVVGEEQSLRQIWLQSISNTNKLSIKSYEFACRLLTFISNLDCENRKIITDLPARYTHSKLNICDYFLNLLKQRYEIFKEQFVDQGEVYYSNLLHGVLTCFSYVLDEVIPLTPTFSPTQLGELRQFLKQFFKQMVKILNFAVEVSSANISTVVLDTLASLPQAEKKMQVDCRGHFLPEKKNTVGTYLDSTALISSMENEEEGIENTLVVSFYLLTREAGLVFQSIGGLAGTPNSSEYIPKEEMIELVNTYFYALINLKHMGSVDRISIGLQKMAKVIFDHEDKELSQMPEKLLNRLLELLSDGKFTNILRRSAGVPYAFSCLLKSQALKRKKSIQKTVQQLLKLAEESSETPIQLRIHALNILKKLFQDSDLRQDLDSHVSAAFICSIRGFTNEQWGVRNSSLMLFSVLANRTLGTKPTLNLLQFFHKCPDLYGFIAQELSEKKVLTMYPPLYPIVLLLSRLLPFDLKEKARMTIKGPTNKQVRKQELLGMAPLLRSAGDNHNYMGRVMTAKAILPFMELNSILPHCMELISQYHSALKSNRVSNNGEHYRLTECFQLLQSYHQIMDSQSYAGMNEMDKQLRSNLLQLLVGGCESLHWEGLQVSPTVHEIYVKIYLELSDRYYRVSTIEDKGELELQTAIIQNCQKSLSSFIQKGCKIVGDLGHSLMYKSFIELLHVSYAHLISASVPTECRAFIDYIQALQKTPMDGVDNQILCLVLEKVSKLIADDNLPHHELVKVILKWAENVSITDLHNDDVVIKILQLLQQKSTVPKKGETIHELMKMEHNSENKKLKVAIFQYLLSKYDDSGQETAEGELIRKSVHQLVDSYSNPDQLGDLRECCIDFFHKSVALHRECTVAYVRMLEDEESELRKLTARRISQILLISPLNEEIMLEQVLRRVVEDNKADVQFLKDLFKQMLVKNSDYSIRLKNHQEERIFSYDKPNKYRTDINTLARVIQILPLPIIRQTFADDPSLMPAEQQFQEVVKKYQLRVMERDEYLFESIVRRIVGSGESKVLEQVSQLHPIFRAAYKRVHNGE